MNASRFAILFPRTNFRGLARPQLSNTRILSKIGLTPSFGNYFSSNRPPAGWTPPSKPPARPKTSHLPTHTIPLTEPFPGSPEWNFRAGDAKISGRDITSPVDQTTKITKLPNGIVVASQDNQSSCASIQVFVRVGPQNEDQETGGASRMLERMSFQSNQISSGKEIVQRFEELGGLMSATTHRDCIVYSADGLKDHCATTIENLSNIVLRPKFDEQEVEEQKEVISMDLDDQDRHFEKFASQWINHEINHQIAFKNQPLGRPTTIDRVSLAKINPDTLRKFHNENFTADRIVVSAYGLPHDQLVQLVEKHFQDAKPAAKPVVPLKSIYVGGQHREPEKERLTPVSEIIPQDRPVTHLYIGWEAPSNMNLEDFYATTVLSFMLGGGGSFSTGGPGKGMYSRFYTNVLNGNDFVESCQNLYLPYDTTGLFGVYCTFAHGYHIDMMNMILQELIDVCSEISPLDFTRARNQLKSTYFGHLESRLLFAEDIGRQVMVYGKHHDSDLISRKIDEVTIGDVQRVLKKMLRTKPTLISYGQYTEQVPDVTEIHNLLLHSIGKQ